MLLTAILPADRLQKVRRMNVTLPQLLDPLLLLYCSIDPLALSQRIYELLVRRARALNPTMALVEVPPGLPTLEGKQPIVPPPAVITSPCDPWPRPYYLENGLRRVAPYHYTYNTYCKKRWRGRELLDIFASEFRDRPEEYYVGFAALKWCWKLTGIERCDRTRSCGSQWQAGAYQAPRPEWGYYLAYNS